jgi:ornithine cyclodeaminase/alanine dehydrogenase-like protein (mu-crystallin family)
MVVILNDADVARLADMPAAIAVVEQLMREKAEGAFVSPPRHRVAFDRLTELVLTIGGSAAYVAGFRAYHSRNTVHSDDQLVAVWDMTDGTLKGIALGPTLGVVRMGAIGGAAIRALARPDAAVVAIVGTGRQAESHLEAACSVRNVGIARVHSRSQDRREAFAARMSARLGMPVAPATTAEGAVESADIVILATTSYRPVIRAEWLSPGAFVHTVGFKSPAAQEMGLDVAERASLIVTDSPQQVAAAGRTFVLYGTGLLSRIVDLSPIVAGKTVARHDDGIVVCYPMGLGGTEVVVASEMFDRYARLGTGPGRDLDRVPAY